MVAHLSILAWEVPLRGAWQATVHVIAKKPESYLSSDWFTELAEKGTSRSDKSSGE